MSQRVKKEAAFVVYLQQAPNKQQKLILSSLTKNQLEVLSEIALNIYTGSFPVANRYLKTLKPFRAQIRVLASREISAKKKRKILLRHIKIVSVLLKPIVNQLKSS